MQAFIFDLDGTLVNSLEDIGQACNATLAAHGYPCHDLPEYRFLVGRGFNRLVSGALPAGEADRLSPPDLAALIDEAKTWYGQHMSERTRPYEGITEALDALAGNGHTLAVLSNKPDNLTVELVRHYFPFIPFTMVRGGKEGAPLKPDPAVPLAMLNQMGFTPSTSYYVGDSDVDILTARNSGMASIGVAWGFRGADELRGAGADHIINEPSGLLTITEGK